MERLTEERQIGSFARLKDPSEAKPGAFADYDCLYAHMVAVTKLKQYEDTGLEPEEIAALILPPNDPLTMDELREMAQRCEGVYVVHVDGSPVFREQKYCAAVLDFSPAFGSNTMHIHAIYGDRLTMWEDDYGKTWLAYRRKPEEGKKWQQ